MGRGREGEGQYEEYKLILFLFAFLFLLYFLSKVIWEKELACFYLILNLCQSSFEVIIYFAAVILASIIFHFKTNILNHYLLDAGHMGKYLL